MADIRNDFLGIKSPNPFWLASAPPTDKEYNVVRAFKAGKQGGSVVGYPDGSGLFKDLISQAHVRSFDGRPRTAPASSRTASWRSLVGRQMVSWNSTFLSG